MSRDADRLHREDNELVHGELDDEGEESSRAARQRTANSAVAATAHAVRAQRAGFLQTGRGSWYGDDLAGKPMANGEPYDPNQMTCAHPTLPFGSKLTVELLDHTYNQTRGRNGEMGMKPGLVAGASVDVTVTDRGPFTGGRIIDLSYAAAEALGAIDAGVFMVGIRRA